MKVLIVFYSKLLQEKDILNGVSEKINMLKKLIGPDSLYAVITSEMKDFIDRFPDLVFIRNDRGTFIYGLYKGLRKLRGNDVLILDPIQKVSFEKLREFVSKRRKNLLHSSDGRWMGLALLRLIDLDYLIRTLEGFLGQEADLSVVMEKLRQEYGIEYEIL